MHMDVRTIRILVDGCVQGVGFRAFVLREARARGVGGFARNLRDGRVEVVAQGDPNALAALAEACGRGPIGSRVARVDIGEAQSAPGDYHAFRIETDA